MNQEKRKQDEVWPPAPRQDDITPLPDASVTEPRIGVGSYLLCLFISVLYWIIAWYVLRSAADAMFPSTALVLRVYGTDASNAFLGLGTALTLIRLKSRFGKPLLISVLISALLFTSFEYLTQDLWQ